MLLISITILVAYLFDFLNGFHDAANSIATIVSTRVLKPHWAVLWAALFNFIAFAFFGLKVATTIGTGLVDPHIVTVPLILIALTGALVWNLLTWYFGLPSSSSHALIGGLLGSAFVFGGIHTWIFWGILKVILAIVFSPLLGYLAGLLFIFITTLLFAHAPAAKVSNHFKRLQLVSSALVSLGHGGNDAQKTMGIIAVVLFASGKLGNDFYVPLWVILSCNFVIALGTLFGGWRIVKTMGMKITKLKPIGGFCAESASALSLFIANFLGIPVSSTQTITGSIVGVGSLYSANAIRWGIAKRIVYAWILTIPAAGLVAGLLALIIRLI